MTTCLTCVNWLPRETPKANEHNRDWPSLGYARCRHDKPWTVYSLRTTCPKHEPCSDETAQKRQAWALRFRAAVRSATDGALT